MQTAREQTILVGEDEFEARGYFQAALRRFGYSVELAQDGDEVLSYLRSSRGGVGAVLLDIMMPNRNGLETLREIRQFAPRLPVIMVSGAASPLNIVNAMKSGATDFLCKPVEQADLRRAIGSALEGEGAAYRISGVSTTTTGALAGNSPAMREIQSYIEQIGWSEAPVLIQGETGSGKEVLARELHARSPRAGNPFLKLNCAALPSELVESELFGYERGAFTGALQAKAGLFEGATGGTILLDEIGDMDVRLQAKLLQVLQDNSFRRLGGKDIVKVDVRVMSATHRDLEKGIVERTFREDLYYRLNVIGVRLPPLRERVEDVIPLAKFLIKKHAVREPASLLTPDLENALISYHWPGNVRELENQIRKLLIFMDPDQLARELRAKSKPASTQSEEPGGARHQESAPPVEDRPILQQVVDAKNHAETRAILAALNSTRWNRKQAAALLKFDYKALLYKMKKLGIESKAAAATSASSASPDTLE